MLSAELDQKCRTTISPGSTGWGVGSIQRDRVQPKAQATRSFPSYCRLLSPPPPRRTRLPLPPCRSRHPSTAAAPLSLLRSPSSPLDWRGVEIRRSSDWFLLLLVRNTGLLRLGCAFCDSVLRSLVFVLNPQIQIFRSTRNGIRAAWVITVTFYFIFYLHYKRSIVNLFSWKCQTVSITFQKKNDAQDLKDLYAQNHIFVIVIKLDISYCYSLYKFL